MDRLLAIYPGARKVEEVLRRESRVGCRFGYRAVTFPQLIDGLWRESGSPAALLSPIGEQLVIEEVLRAPRKPGPESFAPTPGTVASALGLIREFKSAMLEPEDLRDASAGVADPARARVMSLASILDHYNAHLLRMHLADAHDRAKMVLGFLIDHERRGTRPRFLDGVEQLLVSEIYDFSLLQFMIVTALIRIIGDARLTIQAEPHKVNAMRFAELTWNRFVGEESIADKVLPDFVRREGRSGCLGFVVRHVFEETGGAPPPDDRTVRIIEATDRYREVEEIARAIRRAIERPAETKIALDRIAVLARDLGPYLGYLKAVFARYGIPLQSEASQTLASSAPAGLALDLLKLAIDRYRRDLLEVLLFSPLVSVASRQECRTLLKAVGYLDHKTAPLAECIRRYRSSREEDGIRRGAIVDRAATELTRLLDAVRTLETDGTVADHAARLREILRKLGVELSDNPAAQLAAAFAGFEQTLEELARSAAIATPDRRLSPEEFALLLKSALSQAPAVVDKQTAAPTGVQVLTVLDARGLDFDLVFIIGLSDGSFPTYRCEDPLLPDTIRLAINSRLRKSLRGRFGQDTPSAIGKVLRTSSDHNSEDWLLFFLALSTAERDVVLTYPLTDEGGSPLARSPFVAEVLRLLRSDGRGDSILEANGSPGVAPRLDECFTRGEFIKSAAFNHALDARECAAIAGPAQIESIRRRVAIERRRERYLSLPTREETGGDESEPQRLALVDFYDGRVAADERLRAMLLGSAASPRKWSASQLGELGACGFKFFARRVLKLSEIEEPDFEASPPEVGDIVHRVLKELFTVEPDFTDRRAAHEVARRVLESIREKARARARDDAFFDLGWARIGKIVEEVVDFELAERQKAGGPDERLLEEDFEIAVRDRRPVAESEQIAPRLVGCADRVEAYRDGGREISRIRVLDYKTSRDAKHYNEMADPDGDSFGRTDFQLPVYLMAALERFRGELARSARFGAGYFVLRNFGKLRTFAIPRERIETDADLREQIAATGPIDNVADRIVSLLGAAVGGRFDVDPRRCDDYCPFRRVCRYEKPRARN